MESYNNTWYPNTWITCYLLPEGNTLSPFRSIQQTSFESSSYTPNVDYLEVAFSPQDQINDDINAQMGYFNIGEYIGDPRHISQSGHNYPDLDTLRDAYFNKYISSYNLVDFIRLMKFFDNSLFKKKIRGWKLFGSGCPTKIGSRYHYDFPSQGESYCFRGHP